MHRTLRRVVASCGILALAAVPLRAQAPTLTLQDDSANDRLVVTLAPIYLPVGGADPHAGMVQPAAQTVTIPRDGWLRGYSLEIVDAAGHSVPQEVLHHLNLIMPERRELFSPIMLRIGAMGAETAPVDLPRLLGMRVHKGDRLLVTTMLHNPTGRAYLGIRMRITFPFVDASTWLPPFSVYPFYMDVMPPAGIHAYDLPAGKSHKSWEGKPAIAARVLGVGGHLHKYATLLRFEDVTAKEVLWEARPQLDSAGDVVGMPTGKFWWKGGIKIQPDHVYRLTAFYDNPTGQMIPDGGMGAFGGIVIPARGTTWPGIDRNDPQLKKDLAVTYGGMRMGGGAEGMEMGGGDSHTHADGAGHEHRAPAGSPVTPP